MHKHPLCSFGVLINVHKINVLQDKSRQLVEGLNLYFEEETAS